MHFPRFTRGRFGRLTANDLNNAFELLEKLSRFLPALERMKQETLDKQRNSPIFEAEITGHELIPGASYRWLYSWKAVGFNVNDYNWEGFDGGPDIAGLSSTFDGDDFALAAVNGCEHRNAGGDGVPGNPNGIIGPGVDLDGPSYPPGFEPKPISNGVVVQMLARHGILGIPNISGNRSPICHMFCVANAHDGECSTPFLPQTSRSRVIEVQQ